MHSHFSTTSNISHGSVTNLETVSTGAPVVSSSSFFKKITQAFKKEGTGKKTVTVSYNNETSLPKVETTARHTLNKTRTVSSLAKGIAKFTKSTIGDYKYQRDKRFGVEPGFEGTKVWRDTDEAKLHNREHKYYWHALVVVQEKLEEQGKTDPLKAYEAATLPARIKTNDATKIAEHFKEFHDDIVQRLTDHHTKFKKNHFIKLDYSDPVKGKVMIPLVRAKSSRILGPLGKLIYQWSTAATPREKNLGAVKEAMANDIFSVLGFGGQKLKIIKGQYQDGSVKLLLDSTEVSGPSGEKFRTLTGQIKQGYIEGNLLRGEDGKMYPVNQDELAQAKVKALLLGDRDKVGSYGANVGYVVVNGQAHLMNIDPGKSLQEPPRLSHRHRPHENKALTFMRHLYKRVFFNMKLFLFGETDRMAQHDLHSNFSFDHPKDTLKDMLGKGYKNFTIFDDTLLSQKMEGMRTILKNWDDVIDVIDSYIETFSEGDLDFRTELSETKQRLIERKDYFETVMHDRLKLSGPELDFLDNIEKLTSGTRDHIGKGKKKVEFQHLQVIPEQRREWNMEHLNGEYVLTYKAPNKNAAEEASRELFMFAFRSQGFMGVSINDKNELVVRFKEGQFEKMNDTFAESKIKAYKQNVKK